MKIAIYTSFAVNYLAKARVLVDTVKQVNPAIDVIAIICDRVPDSVDVGHERFDQIWSVEDYPASPIKGWIFRHNIMELCTAVKGWGLRRLLDAGYDFVMYLDPDCWVMEDPAKIVELLAAGDSVGVVPHTTRPADSDEEIRIVETSSLRHGIYNLGFLLVRNDEKGRLLANWWAARLDKFCIDDLKNGLFTDQRWFDLALGYFDFIKIIRHRGIDVASWNIGQRTLERNGGLYLIDGDALIFYHFSGVGPTGVHRWVRDKFAPADPLAAEIEFRYERMIAAHGQAELEHITPYFDLYSDGSKVLTAERAAYRDVQDLAQRFPDPYDVAVSPNFRYEAKMKSPPVINNEPFGVDLARSAATEMSIDEDRLEMLAIKLFDAELFRKTSGVEQAEVQQLWSAYKACAWDTAICGNKIFDVSYYKMSVGEVDVELYPSPLHHYVAVGVEQKISPSWIFDEDYYLQKYKDIAEAVRAGEISCAFEHFSRYGLEEGRDGCAYFNEQAYLKRHPDVAEAVALGLIRSGEAHFIRQGRGEGRPFR